jgi:hypothetical protein
MDWNQAVYKLHIPIWGRRKIFLEQKSSLAIMIMDDLSKSRTDLVRRWTVEHVQAMMQGCEDEKERHVLTLNLLTNPFTQRDVWVSLGTFKNDTAFRDLFRQAHLMKLLHHQTVAADGWSVFSDQSVMEAATASILQASIPSQQPRERLRRAIVDVTDGDQPMANRLVDRWDQSKSS